MGNRVADVVVPKNGRQLNSPLFKQYRISIRNRSKHPFSKQMKKIVNERCQSDTRGVFKSASPLLLNVGMLGSMSSMLLS